MSDESDATALKPEPNKLARAIAEASPAELTILQPVVTKQAEEIAQKMLANGDAKIKHDTRVRLEATKEHQVKSMEETLGLDDEFYLKQKASNKDRLAEALAAPIVVPTLCRRTDGVYLFYPGFTNVLYGPSGHGKSFFALFAIAQQIQDGAHCIYFDYENGYATIAQRLMAMGCSALQIEKYLTVMDYVDGQQRPPSPRLAKLEAAELLAKGGNGMVVFDSWSSVQYSIGLEDLNSTMHVIETYKNAFNPWATSGATPVILDHTPKANPLTPYGSERKTSGATGTVALMVKTENFHRSKAGAALVFIHKDRHGGQEHDDAEVPFNGKPTGNWMPVAGQFTYTPPMAATESASAVEGLAEFVPITSAKLAIDDSESRERRNAEKLAAAALLKEELKAKIIDFVKNSNEHGMPANVSSIRGALGGKAATYTEVVDEMLRDNQLQATPGRGGGKNFRIPSEASTAETA